MKKFFGNFKQKRTICIIVVISLFTFLFISFSEIRVKKKLDESVSISVVIMELNGFDVSVEKNFRIETGSAEFQYVVESLNQYRYYKRIFPGKGVVGKHEVINLYFWNEELKMTTWIEIYSDGTIFMNGERARCVPGGDSGKKLFLELQEILGGIL